MDTMSGPGYDASVLSPTKRSTDHTGAFDLYSKHTGHEKNGKPVILFRFSGFAVLKPIAVISSQDSWSQQIQLGQRKRQGQQLPIQTMRQSRRCPCTHPSHNFYCMGILLVFRGQDAYEGRRRSC